MVQRIIKPMLEHARSPITARAVALFLLCSLITYILIHDYLEDRRSDRRHDEITQNQEEARVSRKVLKEQAIITTEAIDRLDATLTRFEALNQNIKDVANILRAERTMRQEEHAAIQSALKLHATRTRTAPSLDCYEMRRQVKKMGAADVVIVDLVRKPKCPS